MLKNLSLRLIFIFVVIFVAFIYVIPSFNNKIWPHNKINLGLDLQGGMHLVLEVETQKAVDRTLERMAQEIKNSLKKEHVRRVFVDIGKNNKILIKTSDKKQINLVEDILDKEFRELQLLSKSSFDETIQIEMELPGKQATYIKRLATEQALETIRNRIDQFGVSEPDIRLQGEQRILIQLPGIKDTKRAKQLIGKTALLEFKLIDEVHDISKALKGNVPRGSVLLYQYANDSGTNRSHKTPYLVKKRALLTGAYLTNSKVQIDSYNEPYVTIDFDKKGARLFAKITEENVHKRLAIVLDNKIYSAPSINEKISGGAARITGNFTTEQAHDLAIVLRAGALPAPVNIIEERTVGPSLGSDSINKGLFSMLVGGVIVIIFMAVYYKGAGLIANLALILNIVLIAGGLAMLQATLTLPGIAGIILTIGMAVDANVLIFERIREEIHIGKSLRSAVDAGYTRATLTILDANITTLIAALVLFQFGTGPIKGFAVTLSLGVIASMFSALLVTRLIFDYFLVNRKIKKLSI